MKFLFQDVDESNLENLFSNYNVKELRKDANTHIKRFARSWYKRECSINPKLMEIETEIKRLYLENKDAVLKHSIKGLHDKAIKDFFCIPMKLLFTKWEYFIDLNDVHLRRILPFLLATYMHNFSAEKLIQCKGEAASRDLIGDTNISSAERTAYNHAVLAVSNHFTSLLKRVASGLGEGTLTARLNGMRYLFCFYICCLACKNISDVNYALSKWLLYKTADPDLDQKLADKERSNTGNSVDDVGLSKESQAVLERAALYDQENTKYDCTILVSRISAIIESTDEEYQFDISHWEERSSNALQQFLDIMESCDGD